ncbi:seryl-tRNA synthetase [Gordoniibacillus kamchatkensis]|uniref:Serine--tRNA ligase n=1 Tax=Gordoniibacillus kamchatkensis TaxID=1590651 RepID=A0ABR5AC96_9BACL|nr:serine--tRNA ligase [Paenibacillus sp. VKM B-2647]KIL38585.1 seryl-tRNA synthetase [Paenibacillus sp. VKM B-2647]
MLEMKWIRENAGELRRMAELKGINSEVERLLAVDKARRELRLQVEGARARRNALAQQVAALKRGGLAEAQPVPRPEREEAQPILEGQRRQEEERQSGTAAQCRDPETQHSAAARLQARVQLLQEEGRSLAAAAEAAEAELRRAEAEYEQLMLLMPNRYAADTPIGTSDAHNVELRRIGEPPAFEFAALDHMELAEKLGLVDVGRGVKVAGSRSYVLTGNGVYLHRAVQQLALDLLAARGFTPMEVPVLAREEALVGTGFFPLGREQTYRLPDDGQWLVGTAEVPLVSYYAGEIVELSDPILLAGVSSCFRREAGSAGRDVRGLYRVHQFAKVEQVVLCRADLDEAEAWLERITGYAEELLALLELPYRVVRVCTGDLGFKNYKQYDIETWMPSRGGYGETHSSSLLLDFQTRRSNIRYRDEDGSLKYAYTLNNTAAASPRILIPLLEVHQREDGSVHVPPALRPYMRGLSELRA